LETDETDIVKKYFVETTDSLVISSSVYEEAFYVGVKLLAVERLSIKGKYDLKNQIKKKGYGFANDFLDRLHKLFELVTLIDDTKNVKSVRDVAEKYRLLPNDALIAATCKHYGIKNIATFDSDFDSVDFLDVVTI
jgi:predicted nucleic acid-binding protein